MRNYFSVLPLAHSKWEWNTKHHINAYYTALKHPLWYGRVIQMQPANRFSIYFYFYSPSVSIHNVQLSTFSCNGCSWSCSNKMRIEGGKHCTSNAIHATKHTKGGMTNNIYVRICSFPNFQSFQYFYSKPFSAPLATPSMSTSTVFFSLVATDET